MRFNFWVTPHVLSEINTPSLSSMNFGKTSAPPPLDNLQPSVFFGYYFQGGIIHQVHIGKARYDQNEVVAHLVFFIDRHLEQLAVPYVETLMAIAFL